MCMLTAVVVWIDAIFKTIILSTICGIVRSTSGAESIKNCNMSFGFSPSFQVVSRRF